MNKHFYLYVDDSGSRFPDKEDSVCRADGMDHFALGGILVAREDKQDVQSKYLSFCADWNITYPLHSTKIRGSRGDFAWLEESAKRKERFLRDLEDFLISLPVIGFAAVIHRPGYNDRYKEEYGDKRWWMCRTAYSILEERAVKYVGEQHGKLSIRFEECGEREDRAIAAYAHELKTAGAPFNTATSSRYAGLSPDQYKNVVLGEPRRRRKSNLFIQLADMYLYPMAKRRYDESYHPWVALYKNGKVIDAHLPPVDVPLKGIKYSCFDNL